MYDERDAHDGEYLNHLVKVCDYRQELKDKLFIKAYQCLTEKSGGYFLYSFVK